MIKPAFPKFFRRRLFKYLFYLPLAAVVFSAGYFFALSKSRTAPPRSPNVTISREIPVDKNLDFSLFWKVWDTLEESYYDQSKIIPADLVYGAIKGMVDAVGDPYTTFLIPRENEIIQEDLQGNFEGVGIQIGFRGSRLAVIAPLPGSPADKAGVEPGDLIIGIKDDQKQIDRTTVGINLPDAVQSIRGPAGTSVTLALVRDGIDDAIIVDLTREAINVPSVSLEFIGIHQNVAHIKLLKFGGETVSEWDNVVLEILKKRDLSGVIVDVRNDTGGYLQAAIDIASDFLATGDIVVIEEKDSQQKEYPATRPARLNRDSVVVLVNQGSASASEILAGALRDHLKIPLVGETTFGKGTIQEPRQINGGAALHITVAKWLTPNKIWINEVGLEPDVIIEDNPDTASDEQLEEAVRILENS